MSKTKKIYVTIIDPPWYDTDYSYNLMRFRQSAYFDKATSGNLVDFWQVGATADADGVMSIRFRLEIRV